MRPPYGANCLVTIGSVSCGSVTIPNSLSSRWVQLANGVVPLRCWLAELSGLKNDIDSRTCINRVYIVLPEVFGVSAWVRSVADHLAAQGYPALAVPLFSRTAPNLELALSRPIWPKGGFTRTPPPPSRSLVMLPLLSAG